MRIIDVLNSPWAIVPEKLREITEIYATHLRGEKIDIAAVEAKVGAPLQNERAPYEVVDGVAVINLEGPMAKKMNLFTRVSGGVSTQIAARDIRAALADPAVAGIVLNIDSPGGTVDGTQELADVVRQAAQQKPLVAYTDGMMASAAYWVGSAAGGVFISGDTVHVGSIGVVTQHVDYSGWEAQKGMKTTEITAGAYKRIASETAPLTDAGRAYLQQQVDEIYATFLAEVARNRGSDAETVHKNMADGRIFIGQRAIEAGLVDGVSTLSDLVGRLARGEVPVRKALQSAGAPTGHENSGGSPGKAINNEDIEMNLTLESLKQDHPDLAAALQQEGADAERLRIQLVQAQLMPGHEALIEELKFDGKTTGEQAAVQVLAAEKQVLNRAGKNLATDGAGARAAHDIAPAAPAVPATDEQLSPEAQAKQDWDTDAALRAEFGNDFKAYEAYRRADSQGRVRVLAGKQAA